MEFPRDIEMHIIRKLDIDTRRRLGIYTKMNVPNEIKDTISKVFSSTKRITTSNNLLVMLPLGPVTQFSSSRTNTANNFNKYRCILCRFIQASSHIFYSIIMNGRICEDESVKDMTQILCY